MKICILGATGLVGRETLELVARAWPDATLDLYASRDQTLTLGGKDYPVKGAPRLEEAGTEGGDLAFVALDDDHSRRYVPRLLELGYRVVDKSNTYRMDPKVPLVVGGVNCTQLADGESRLAANPNCTTIPFALAVAPLMRRWGLTRATVSSYQAISGAGIGALDGFLQGSKESYASADRLGTRLDASAYVGNTVPHNGKTDDSGFSSEERKLMNESRKILSLPSLAVSAQCCRVPVAVGHYINAWIELEQKVELSAVEQVLQSDAPFVRFLPGAAGEGLSALAGVHDRDRALVGRLRLDPRGGTGTALCLTVTADNLRLGAATNAVRLANQWFPGQDADLRMS